MQRGSLPTAVEHVMIALSRILVPPNPDVDMAGFEEDLAYNCARMIWELPAVFRFGFCVVVRLFDWFPFLFGFGLKRFSSLAPEFQAKYVDTWAESTLVPCREFFKTLKAMVMLVYFSDQRIWKYINYNPKPHLEERIELRKRILGGTDH